MKLLVHNPRIKVGYNMENKSDYTHFLFDVSPVINEAGRNVDIDGKNSITPGITFKGVTIEPEFLAKCLEDTAKIIRKTFCEDIIHKADA